MRFNLPPLTNKSDIEFSTAEKVETMYTVEVPVQLEGKTILTERDIEASE